MVWWAFGGIQHTREKMTVITYLQMLLKQSKCYVEQKPGYGSKRDTRIVPFISRHLQSGAV